MISVEQATETVLNNSLELKTTTVPLAESTGRVLREDLVADRDFPPFDRVSMDGIAIRFASYAAGRRKFEIEGLQAAGAPRLQLGDPENCLEVMTGAILPENADTVIRYEDLSIQDGIAAIQVEKVAEGQNVHARGLDRKAGSVIVKAGCRVSAAEVGVAATIGKAQLKVVGMPVVAIISTGDELVEVTDSPLPHQIRKSNVHNLAAAAGEWGLRSDMLHLADDKDEIRGVMESALERYDALLLSGGVSAGKLDFLPEVFEELGVEKLFHKVTQRPGKPFWFGRAKQGAVIFAFPGNPVSSFMCFHRYFIPWLRASLGLPAFERTYAMLEEDLHFKPALTYFLQVRLASGQDGTLRATPLAGKGSGDLANLADADAFMELPKDRTTFSKGEVFPVMRYRK